MTVCIFMTYAVLQQIHIVLFHLMPSRHPSTSEHLCNTLLLRLLLLVTQNAFHSSCLLFSRLCCSHSLLSCSFLSTGSTVPCSLSSLWLGHLPYPSSFPSFHLAITLRTNEPNISLSSPPQCIPVQNVSLNVATWVTLPVTFLNLKNGTLQRHTCWEETPARLDIRDLLINGCENDVQSTRESRGLKCEVSEMVSNKRGSEARQLEKRGSLPPTLRVTLCPAGEATIRDFHSL